MKKIIPILFCAVLSACSGFSDEKVSLEVKIPQIGDENYYNDYISPDTPTINAIDMGLSVKWADRNVGAQSPEDYGGYYVWADPCGAMLYFPYDDFPLSCIQGTKHDIATANLPAGWRLPTTAELYELVENCTNSFAEINGVEGCRLTAKNGASIFLPYAGYRYGTKVGFGGTKTGYLWAGNYDGEKTFAFYLWFGQQGDLPSYMNMSYGISVRPVYVNSDENNDDTDVSDVCAKMNDPVFMDYCKKRFDFDADGKISMDEAQKVTKIDISELDIASVKGVEYFTNLEYFTASKSNLVMADLRRNTKLTSVMCSSCKKLVDINLPENIKEIGMDAFCSSSLKSIKIPDSVESIGETAFFNSNLESAIVGSGVKQMDNASIYGVFSKCKNLRNVTLKPGLTTLGRWMFYFCENLEKITIPSSIVNWGDNTFASSGLKKVVIEDGITEIGNEAFRNCRNLEDVYIPEGVTTIGTAAFRGCALERLTIPSSVREIKKSAFLENLNLASVYCKPTVPPIADKYLFSSEIANLSIFVPMESVDAYKTAECWSSFASFIQGYDF